MNSSKIRPETEGIETNVDMSTIRICPFTSNSSSNSSSTSGSYYFSFVNKDNPFQEKLCPYVQHPEGSICTSKVHEDQVKTSRKLNNYLDDIDRDPNEDDEAVKVSYMFCPYQYLKSIGIRNPNSYMLSFL